MFIGNVAKTDRLWARSARNVSYEVFSPLWYQHIECLLYMCRDRDGKKARFAPDGKAEAVCAELQLFNVGSFPQLFI